MMTFDLNNTLTHNERKMLKEFNDYLCDQIGKPYVWGGQHARLTPDN